MTIISEKDRKQIERILGGMGVPKTMINGRQGIDGAMPESALVPMLLLSTKEGVA